MIGMEALEDEAIRRGKDGIEEPVFYQGEVCGHVRKFSDVLLMFALKANRPEKFRDNASFNLTGSLTLEGMVKEIAERRNKAEEPK